MEIVVNDTNILIDLCNSGLLPYCKKLNIEFRTIDFIINEINISEQSKAINEMIDDGTLKVFSLSSEQIIRVYQKVSEYQGVCNLSPEDIAIMIYALDNKCRLLTGDKKLRDKATTENVVVSGILYITDLMVSESVISNSDMIEAFDRMLKTNNRLPRKLINERIEKLRGK